MDLKNEILLRRKNMFEVNLGVEVLDMDVEADREAQKVRETSVASVAKNLTFYGYMLDEAIVEKLKNASYDDIVKWYFSIREIVRDLVGSRENMEPLYKNFPNDTMEPEKSEMYLASYLYFISHGQIAPDEYEFKPELNEFCNLTLIKEADEEAFNEIFTNLLSSKVALGDVDKKDLNYFVCNVDNFYELIPDTIPNKENLISFTNLCIAQFGYDSKQVNSLAKVYKTATDVLRLAVAMSDGDTSLAKKTKFKSFKRSERRFLLSLLDNVKYPLEDMFRYKTEWIALGEVLHPGDFSNKYKNAYENFSKLRNNEKVPSFYGKVNAAFDSKDLKALLKLLSSRPGEFARTLDRALSAFASNEESQEILEAFTKVASKVETTVLIGLMNHMKDRKNSLDTRIFFPKGHITKAFFIENNMKPLADEVVDKAIEICRDAIISIYKEKEAMGKVYLDEALKEYVFPMTLRNAGRALKPLARGTKLYLKDNCTTARVFVYWHETPSQRNIDLDLSVILLNEDYGLIDYCYYGNLGEKHIREAGCFHSGDMREAPNGATENIDLDFEKLKAKKVKYVLTCVHSFTQEPFYELQEAFVGIMERECPESGEVFEPATVVTRSDLATSSQTSLAMMVDVDERSMTWLDLSSDASNAYDVANNVRNSKSALIPMTKAFMNRNYATIYDIISLNVEARGEFVDNKADADYIFSMEGYVEPEVEETDDQANDEVVEDVKDDELEGNAGDESKEDEVPEEVVELPKRILVTPFGIDVLIGNYL